MGDDPNNISPGDAEQMRRDEGGISSEEYEELRATNERLRAMNEELQGRIADLSRSNKDRSHELLRRIVTAQEDERSRIARNLHDHLGQQLTALRLQLDAVKNRDGWHAELEQMLEQAQKLAKELDTDVDFLSWELRPPALDNFGLAMALDNFVEEWSKHFNIPAKFHTSALESLRFSQDLETNLYRIAQEALNNIYKHSQATRVEVICEYRVDHVTLIIEDNGQGFDNLAVERAEEKGMGLIGMRERAALLGGAIEIESHPGNGTTIFVRVPLRSEKKGEAGVHQNEQNPRPAR